MHSGSVWMNCITCRYRGIRTAVWNNLCCLLTLLRFWWQRCNDSCNCSVDSDCCDKIFSTGWVAIFTFVPAESCGASRPIVVMISSCETPCIEVPRP